MIAFIKTLISEYWDDILEYLLGLTFIKFGIINVFAIFLEKWGLTFDHIYFGATGGFTWWLIQKYREQLMKEQGKVFIKVSVFRGIIYLLLSMIFAVLFTSLLQKTFFPQLLLPIVAFGTGLFWEIVYNYLKKIFSNGIKIKDDFEEFSSDDSTEHPNKPGG